MQTQSCERQERPEHAVKTIQNVRVLQTPGNARVNTTKQKKNTTQNVRVLQMPGNARISTTKQKYKTINTKRTSPANARNETRNKTKTEKTERWFWLNTTDAEMQAKLRKCKRNFGNSQSSTARSPSKEPV